METLVKSTELYINGQEFKTMVSDLEKLMQVEPNEKIIKNSKKMNWTIDERDIIILQKRIGLHYRVEFHHNEKENERKKCYLGSIEYSSPVTI
jgi:hypothetical protein